MAPRRAERIQQTQSSRPSLRLIEDDLLVRYRFRDEHGHLTTGTNDILSGADWADWADDGSLLSTRGGRVYRHRLREYVEPFDLTSPPIADVTDHVFETVAPSEEALR